MGKWFYTGLAALALAAVYFGVVTLRAGNDELFFGFRDGKSAAVEAGSTVGDAPAKVKSDEK
ncbi:hypothetical protein [Pseudodesulfovibrio indicus]|uniref:Uncharacterized protein n=1 Tax=Pseudodesulfovibrio indicus TaxID=1716143 RepID=A0A126QML3_9BACT|nr:hypothetical protein [Pseudodesulfovibrio indicus]AMK10908.1 hypothetical protein AWY79_07190 [Pseudodesulfovibrio indicus]TDT91900.1 hypothetical protein EDC59_101303 [Pseudodesulfovibrio indicus]